MASPTRCGETNLRAMHYTYVLQSESDCGLYIGYSGDLRRRLTEHRAGAARATAHRAPWRLVYYEACMEEADARGREEFLKSGAGRSHLKKQSWHHFAKHPARASKTSDYPIDTA